MSNSDDFLGKLLSKPAAKKQAAPAPGDEPASEQTGPGLTSLDLLTLPADQRKLINWLTRKKEATFEEIQEALGETTVDVENVLTTLKHARYIKEVIHDGKLLYRVVFRTATRKKSSGIANELWSRVDLDHKTFLKQLQFFQELSDEEINEISHKVEERSYDRDEVIFWQGDITDHIYFIKTGVVGVTRISPQDLEKNILNYLKPGDILGEYSVLLKQGGSASATVTALSNVTMLLISKPDFLDLLQRYPAITVELVRILVQRLLAANARLNNAASSKLCLFIGIGIDVGLTTLGSMMSMTLSRATRKTVVYTEQPVPNALATLFNADPKAQVYKHPAGYNVVIAHESPGLSQTVRTTLLYERLISQYETIVIGVQHESKDILPYLVERADQVIFVTTPEPEKWDELNKVSNSLRAYLRPERVVVFTTVNRTKPEHASMPTPGQPGQVDFDLPYTTDIPPLIEESYDRRPAPIAEMMDSLADRLGRANQISVYIPTTINVNEVTDTTAYVERTLAFLGERFGGATASQARGIWNSNQAGLVGEDIHIIRSYATQADLDKNLQSIIDYIEQLKQELKQEAMAIEINQKLLLI